MVPIQFQLYIAQICLKYDWVHVYFAMCISSLKRFVKVFLWTWASRDIDLFLSPCFRSFRGFKIKRQLGEYQESMYQLAGANSTYLHQIPICLDFAILVSDSIQSSYPWVQVLISAMFLIPSWVPSLITPACSLNNFLRFTWSFLHEFASAANFYYIAWSLCDSKCSPSSSFHRIFKCLYSLINQRLKFLPLLPRVPRFFGTLGNLRLESMGGRIIGTDIFWTGGTFFGLRFRFPL